MASNTTRNRAITPQHHQQFSVLNSRVVVVVAGVVERIPGDLEHYSYRDLADQVDRIRTFSAIEADGMFHAGRPTRLRDLVLRPPARFLRAYLLKTGFLDGWPGLAIASLTAFHVFLKYALLRELHRSRGHGGER